MKFSTSIEYAIHGLVYLARGLSGVTSDVLSKKAPDRVILLSNIAKETAVPESYLRKVFQTLSKRGIVMSQRGVGGGYFLARKPEEITLRDVVEAIEGFIPAYCCREFRRKCSIGENCPIRKSFDRARDSMYEVLEGTTIKRLAEELSKHENEVGWLKVIE